MSTIFAPLTLKGLCSIYVIRISGRESLNCLKALGIQKTLIPQKATLCKIKDKNNEILDEALVIYFKAPHSFTGEDVVEINLHCSNYIISKVFSILSSIENVRMAEKGEFSKRAFLNNKIDLMQAESIVDLINAETEMQHKLAINQLQGKNSNFYNNLRQKIVEILSLLEAFIDFPEEDIPQDMQDEILAKISNIKIEIQNNLNDDNVGEKIRDGFHISIIGEPNAGKSTLLNYLSKRDIAIVSDIAGTTRDIIEVSLNISGIPVILYDTAGIRETEDIIEKEGVKRAIRNANTADIKILVIDSNNLNIDKNIIDLIDKNTIILLNKIDILKNKNIDKNIFKDAEILKISLKDKINLDKFLDILKNKLESIVSPNINTTITNERYRNELEKALEYLEFFNFDLPIEINAENIRMSADCIGRITGKINSDEILDNIFSKFCIGK